jgi:TonB family protein
LSDLPANLEWRSTDGSTRVSMPIGLADRIAGYSFEAYKSVPRRGAEAGGLLLGGVRLGPVIDIFINGFEPIPCDYKFGPSFIVSEELQKLFRAAIARFPPAEILGYYRSHTRKNPALDFTDQDLVDHVFPGLSGLVLLIKPSGVAKITGSYYFFQTGRLEMRSVGPEFPFLTTVPGGTPPPAAVEADASNSEFAEVMKKTLAASTSNESAVAPPAEVLAPVKAPVQPKLVDGDQDAERRKQRKRLQWEVVASGLMIAAALALLWWQYHGPSGEEAATVAQAAPSHVSSLGLAVHPGEGGWRITWDPASLAARESVKGVLNVTEDESRERIPLTAAQVRNGSATYRPIGDDITFRLDLVARDSSLSTETYRVLMKPPTVQASQPKPPPTPEAATPKPPKKAEEAVEEAYVDSEVLTRVAPEVPEGIRPRITEPMPIDVKVAINRAGKVTKATVVQHEDGLVDFLGKRAVAAAQRWTFTPAKRGGKAVESTRTIHFVFEQ